jgi:hypothetical protein
VWGRSLLLCSTASMKASPPEFPESSRMDPRDDLGSGSSKRGPKAPRPPNAWILYRSAMLSRMSQDGGLAGRQQAELSKIIAERWRSESTQVRRHYEHEAERRKLEHGPDSPSMSQIFACFYSS